MLIIHAGFRDDKLLLWGETPVDSAIAPPKRRGRKPKTPRPEPFPYDPGSIQLKEALLSAGFDVIVDEVEPSRAIAWLPTVRDIPVPSSPLIAKPLDARVKPKLQPWEVSVIALTLIQAVELLCVYADKQLLCPGVVVGNDLTFCVGCLNVLTVFLGICFHTPSE